ncbi:unnamed protein product [Symbiodinium natans]|uniref:Uncharacterized protein n=1 Tax=Symbiodinium natans TaxID=878477 RepID=A0A812QHY3_9DINO|nr:unnamed protein product [Symbiodinium natans]
MQCPACMEVLSGPRHWSPSQRAHSQPVIGDLFGCRKCRHAPPADFLRSSWGSLADAYHAVLDVERKLMDKRIRFLNEYKAALLPDQHDAYHEDLNDGYGNGTLTHAVLILIPGTRELMSNPGTVGPYVEAGLVWLSKRHPRAHSRVNGFVEAFYAYYCKRQHGPATAIPDSALQSWDELLREAEDFFERYEQ